MIKNECDIIKDLIPNYLEKTLRPSTNEFIENHIKSCQSCSKLLNELKNEDTEENRKDTKSNNFEINYLKKYNKKYGFLKFIIIIFIIFDISIFAHIWYERINFYNLEDKAYQINEILDCAYNITKSFITENNNFSFSKQDITNNNLVSFYYKGNKFKITSADTENNNIFYTQYGVKTEDDIQLIHYYAENDIHLLSASTNDIYVFLSSNNHLLPNCIPLAGNGYIAKSYELRENDTFQDRQCYVIRYYIHDNTENWQELWIDKENMTIIRDLSNYFVDKHDYVYTWTSNTVTDEELTLPSTSRHDEIEGYNEVLELFTK